MSFLFDAIILFAYRKSVEALLILSLALTAFGALTIVQPEWSGGVSLLVGTVASVLFVFKITLQTKFSRLLFAALDLRQLGLLTAYTFVALCSAMILPRLMSHIEVYPVSSVSGALEPVGPSTGNITQSLYTFVSFSTALAFVLFVRRKDAIQNLRRAFIISVVVLIITGFVDIAAGSVGASDALDIFRTASYAFMVDNEVLNVRRTIGFMSEASAFGSLCVSWCAILLFTRYMFPKRERVLVVTPLALICALLAILSTSSSAYGALAITVIVFLADCFWRLFSRRPDDRKNTQEELAVFVFGLFVGIFLLIVLPSTREGLFDLLNEILINKSKSTSFEERNAWTEAGWAAFEDSFGLGVGVGSVRTSNMFVNILASTGLVGSIFFVGFLCRFYLASATNVSREHLALLRGSKLATIPAFATAAFSGTMPDYGTTIAALFGITIGIATHSAFVRQRSPWLAANAQT